MKKIRVYEKNGCRVYEDLYVRHLFQVKDSNDLVIFERDEITGEEVVKSWYRQWDYFTIEED